MSVDREVEYGNPNGDVVDNSAGENPVDGAEADRKSNQGIRSTGGQGTSMGMALGRYGGKPSWLAGLNNGSFR